MSFLKKIIQTFTSQPSEEKEISSQDGVDIIEPSPVMPSEQEKKFKSILTSIGNLERICPNCNKQLEKKPGRKSKCPHCGNFIYVRTRPLDRQRVLVTESQASELEEQWSRTSSLDIRDHVERDEIERVQDAFRKKSGAKLSEGDAKLYIFNKELLEHANNGDWGLYRNTKLSMGSVLENEGKLKQALQTYLEVCYLDLNGPNNVGGIDDPDLLLEYPPFDLELAFLAPAVVAKLPDVANKLQFGQEEVRDNFFQVASRLYKDLQLPLSPKQAWAKLLKEIPY